MKALRLVTTIISIILCMVFVVGANAGTGHEYEKEILFRDIPWGTNAKEVDKMFPDDRLSEDTWIIYPETLHELVPWFPTQKMRMVRPAKLYDISYPDFKVAGYSVRKVHMCFARIPTEEGKVNDDDLLTALYAGSYEISTYNLESKIPTVVDDLKKKLTSLYGDIYDTHVEKPKYQSQTEKYYIWKGQNGTYVMLKFVDHEWDEITDDIYIIYLWEEGDKLLKVADDALYAQAEATATDPPYKTDNNDGL